MKNPALAASGAITALAGAYTAINLEADKTNKTLVALTGSQEKANEILEYARKVANNLGTDVNETAKVWVNFDATMQSLGRTQEQSKSFFEALSNAIIQSGGSMDDVNETVEEFREGLTEGAINGENLEQILRERLPRAFDEMAKSVGISNEELGKMLEEGMEIQQILPLLETGIKNAFGDPTKIISVDAAFARLRNSIQNLLTDTTTGSMDGIAFFIDKMASSVNSFNEMIEAGQADLTKWLGKIGSIADYVSGNIKSFDDLKVKLKELDDTHEDDLKRIAKAHEDTGNKAKEAGDKQQQAVSKATIALGQVKKEINDIVDGYDRLGAKTDLVGQAMSSIGKKIDLSQPKESIEMMTVGLEELKEKSGLSSQEINEGLVPAFEKLSDTDLDTMLKEVSEQTGNYEVGTEKAAIKTALLNEQQNRLGKSSLEVAKSNEELANAQAKVAESYAESVALTGTERQNAEALVIAKKKQIDAVSAHIDVLLAERNEAQRQLDSDISLAGGIDNVSQSKRNEFEARQRVINTKNQEVSTNLQSIKQLDDEAKKLERTASSTEEYYRALKKIHSANLNRLEVNEKVIDRNIDMLESEADLAQQMGDTETATKKQNEANQLKIEKAETQLAQQQQILAGMEIEYQKTLSQALADGQLTEQEKELLQIQLQRLQLQQQNVAGAEQNLNITQQQTGATKKAVEGIDLFTNAEGRNAQMTQRAAEERKKSAQTYTLMESAAAKSVRQLNELSAGAREMVNASLGIFNGVKENTELTSESLEKLRSHLKLVDSAIYHNTHTAGILAGAYLDMANAANETWKAFDEQAISAEELTLKLKEMAETGVVDLGMLQQATIGTTGGFRLLDKQRLDNLKEAVKSVNEKLEEMKEKAQEAKDELAALNEEILREKGNTDEADRLALETERTEKLRKAEIDLNDAKIKGNKELIDLYETQIRKINELYSLKDRNLNQDIIQRKREQEQEQGKTQNTNTNTNTNSGSSGISGTRNFTFSSGDKSATIPVGDVSEQQVNQMLEVFKRSGLTLA